MFLFVSDLHLQRTAWRSREELCGDSFRAWKEVVEYAITQKADAVVLGGDNVDEPRPCAEVVSYLAHGVRMLTDHDIPLYFIQGQHCRSKPPWPSIFGGIRLDGVSQVDGIKVGAVDNMPAQELQAAVADLPKDIRILFLHQLCKDSPCVNWDFDPQWVEDFEGLELVLMGDLHLPWEHALPGNKKIMYGGSCAMQSIDEPWQKSFIRVETKKERLSVTRVPLKSRQKLEYTIESENDLVAVDQALKAVAASEVAPLVVIRHHAAVPVAKLRTIHADKVLVFKPMALMAPAAPDATIVPAMVSLEKNLDLVVERKEKPELHSFLLSALTAEDVKAVVEAKCSPAGELPKESQ